MNKTPQSYQRHDTYRPDPQTCNERANPGRIGRILQAIMFTGVVAILGACTTTTPVAQTCDAPLGHQLPDALITAENRLSNGCAYHFDAYLEDLLRIAADRPAQENRQHFSDSLVRLSDRGIISRAQASAIYNRYFNVKFVTLQGDYNTCAQICPNQRQVFSDMETELADKERGLMNVVGDKEAYFRADSLFKETQLVLEATCRACTASR